MQITPLGDSALIIQVRDTFEKDPDDAIRAVLQLERVLENADVPGIIEVAPAYTTVAVFYDPVEIIKNGAAPDTVVSWLEKRIRAAIAGTGSSRRSVVEADDPGAADPMTSRILEIPVCYEKEFALDLDDVAKHTGLTPEQVVHRHAANDYRVSCIGFTPGFPYLTGLPSELATPRRATPRRKIASGSVAIGGRQTGIYPVASPGGWNVIGRTALILFDPQKNPPALLHAGDRVRFRSISRAEFERERPSFEGDDWSENLQPKSRSTSI
jgi:inhibitor of KinA